MCNSLYLLFMDYPIRRVAHEAGFKEHASFTKIFIKIFGKSPSHFKKEISSLIKSNK